MSGHEIESARILIVDDEEANIELLERILAREGFADRRTTTDPRRVSAMLGEYLPDLILLDLRMPYLSGFDVLGQLKAKIVGDTYLPILVLTADITNEAKRRSLSMGAKDFLAKPFDSTEVVLRVRNLLETRRLHLALQRQNETLEERVRERTANLWEAIQRLTESEAATREATEDTIRRLAIAAELRDEETAWHVERMSRYAAVLAAKVGIDPERGQLIRVASSLHDIGKIGVPDRILRKRGSLTDDDMAVMQQHPVIGYQILADSKAEVLQVAATISLTHHERFDGKGYPTGLRGEEIPVEGRVAAVADVFDALTSNRIYRKASPLGVAFDLMAEGRGTQFDPRMLDAFTGSLDEVFAIMEQFRDQPHKQSEVERGSPSSMS